MAGLARPPKLATLKDLIGPGSNRTPSTSAGDRRGDCTCSEPVVHVATFGVELTQRGLPYEIRVYIRVGFGQEPSRQFP